MANQLYGYNTSAYSSRSVADSYLSTDTSLLGSSSRYLSSDPLYSSSSSDAYSTRIPGATSSTHLASHISWPGPPGVDASTDSHLSGFKRSASDTLYHQSILDAHNAIAATEAWYSTNPLAKRPRYENAGNLPIYPQRPGEKDCAHYMLTRTCKFGDSCKFDHPIWVPEGGIPDWKEVPLITTSEVLPERPGEPDCPYFLKTQRCKFGLRCKFNHPKDNIAAPGTVENLSTLPERPSEPPCAFYMKTGKCKFGVTCKFHHPKDITLPLAGQGNGSIEQNESVNMVSEDSNIMKPLFTPALLHNSKGLPVRPGEVDCPFYLKTGSCKYGATCRYNHPDRNAIIPPAAAVASAFMASPAHLNIGIINPTASILQTYDPRLTHAMIALSPTVYPQRPGQIECDFYMKTGECKFGDRCKFHHPLDRTAPTVLAMESLEQNVKLTLAGLPRREGAIHCPYYMKTGTCKYGATCKFDHPPPGEVMAMATSQGIHTSDETEVKEDGKEATTVPEELQ